jgi:hypothetical protein
MSQTCKHLSILPVLTASAMLLGAAPALADSYPVSGKWTYDVSGTGPAKECGPRYMSFEGNQRRDTGGGVPAYRNFSVTQTDISSYSITDQFATGQINARSTYTLRVLGPDRIEIDLNAGPVIPLRRCE